MRVALDKPGRDISRKYQKKMNEVLKTMEGRPQHEQIARESVIEGHWAVDLEKHRNRNIDLRRALSFNLRSKHTRKQDREKMMNNKGRVQPVRKTVFEPMVFASARMDPVHLPPRQGCQQSRILKRVRYVQTLLDKTLPKEKKDRKGKVAICAYCGESNDPDYIVCSSLTCRKKRVGLTHAGAKRGRAALVAKRLCKQPRMEDRNQPLLNTKLCGSWAGRMFDPKGF